MAIGDFLLKGSADDAWSERVMLLLLLMLGFGIFFISANIATQDISQINNVVFYGLLIVISLLALVGKHSKLQLFDIIGLRNSHWTAIGIFIGITFYTLIIVARSVFDPSVADPGNILPFGSLISVEGAKLFQLVVYAPLVETIGLVAVGIPTLILLMKKFEFTRRLMAVAPFFVILMLISAFALFFTALHIFSYSQDILGQPNFADLFAQKLVVIFFMSFVWILTMLAFRNIVVPITMHVLMNWFAYAAIVEKQGQTVGIIELLLWIILPLFILYGFVTVITKLLPKARGVVS